MIIQRLIDNFNVEKNEKECIEQQMINKDRDFVETKTRLVLFIILFTLNIYYKFNLGGPH